MPRFFAQIEHTETAFVPIDADSVEDAKLKAQLNAGALMREAKDRYVLGGPRVTHVLPDIFSEADVLKRAPVP